MFVYYQYPIEQVHYQPPSALLGAQAAPRERVRRGRAFAAMTDGCAPRRRRPSPCTPVRAGLDGDPA